jgi:hypothetical protein
VGLRVYLLVCAGGCMLVLLMLVLWFKYLLLVVCLSLLTSCPLGIIAVLTLSFILVASWS